MQTSITNINIPEPCRQNWGDMTPNTGGRHCDSCCKTVVDFTRMSDRQVIDFLSVAQNTCGRIEPWQIRSVNRQLAYQPRSASVWKSFVATVALCFAVALAHGQIKPKIKQSTKKELVATQFRPKRDSMIAYHPALKIPLPAVTLPVIKTEVIRDVASNLSGVLGGVSVGIGVVSQNHQPIGYFRTFEDLLQVITR